jgi:hypothetical protein
MWEALQHAGWVTTLAESRPLYGLLSVVHFSSVFLSVGAIVLLDLRILGIAARSQAVSAFAQQLRPLTWIGFGAVVVSGFLLFAVDASDFAAVTPFRMKMLLVALAVLSAVSIEWSVATWQRSVVPPLTARLVALVSLLLWLGALLVSVEIPALTGLG